jgi:hypothetical protein
MQRVFFKSSSHFNDNVQSQWSFINRLLFLNTDEDNSWALLRKRDALRNDARTIETKENESDDNMNDDETLWISSANKFSSRWIVRSSSFFKNVSNIMIIFFNLDEDHNEIDCDANEDFEIINDDVNENDDEIRSKKKSTKIALWFFFFSIDDNTIEEKRTTKIVFRFFFFLKRVTNNDDSVKRMTNDNDDDNVVNDEFEHDANLIRNESYFSFICHERQLDKFDLSI